MNHLSVKIAIDDVPALLDRLGQYFKLEHHPAELEEVDFVYITKDEKIKLRDNDAAFDRIGVKSIIREKLNKVDAAHRDSHVSFETDVNLEVFEQAKRQSGLPTYQVTKHRRVYRFPSLPNLRIYVDSKIEVVHVDGKLFRPDYGFIELQLSYEDAQKQIQADIMSKLIVELNLQQKLIEPRSYGDMGA